MLIRVTGPNFVAGIVLDHQERVAQSAPIVKWAKGKTLNEVRVIAAQKGFHLTLTHVLTGKEIEMGADL